MWELNVKDDSISCELVCEVNAGVRISCLCSFTKRTTNSSSGGGVGKEKTKSGVDDDNNDDGETESPDAKSAKKRNEGDGNVRTASKKVKFS